EEVAQTRDPQHIGDLVRVADRRRHAVRKDAAVEFERSQKRGFDVAVGVDETGDHHLAADVDLAFAPVFAHRTDDAVVADRNIARRELAANEIEDPPALQHHIGLSEPLPLLDGALEKGNGVAHAALSNTSNIPWSEIEDSQLASFKMKRKFRSCLPS